MLIEHPQAWGHDGLPGILFQCLTIPSVKNTLSLSFPSPPSFFFFSLFSCSIFLFFIFYFFFFPLFFFSFLFLFFLFVFPLFLPPPCLFARQWLPALEMRRVRRGAAARRAERGRQCRSEAAAAPPGKLARGGGKDK